MVSYPGCLEPRGFLRHETFRDKNRKVLGKLEYIDHSERETDDVYEKAKRDLCNLRRNQRSFGKSSCASWISHVRLCEPMDCSPPGSSVLGILQARVLEWVAISFSRESSRSRDQTQVSCNAGRLFTMWATREAPSDNNNSQSLFLCAV